MNYSAFSLLLSCCFGICFLYPSHGHAKELNTTTVRFINSQSVAPELPDVSTVTVYCQSTRPTVASLKTRYGNNIRVYSSETATNFLGDPLELNHNQTYYISAYEASNGESLSRAVTKVFISDPKLTANKNNICGNEEVSITASGVPQAVADFEFANPSFEKFLTHENASYYLRKQSMAWNDAQTLIQSLGAGSNMYMINNKAEEDAVFNALNSLGIIGTSELHFWMGLRQNPALNPNNTVQDGWQWLDGRMLTDALANWASGEPDDNGQEATIGGEDGGEDYAQFDLNQINSWRDVSDNSPFVDSWPVIEFTPATKATWGKIDPKSGEEIYFEDVKTSVLKVNPLETTTYFYEFSTAGIMCREEIVITVIDTPELLPASDFELCASPTEIIAERERSLNFDLSKQEAAIVKGLPNTEILFFTSLFNAENLTGAIDTSIPFENTVNPQPIYYRTKNTTTGCSSVKTGTFNLVVASPPEITIPPHFECDDTTSGSNTDQIQEFDLTLNDARIFQLMNATSTEYSISYHLSMADARDLTKTGVNQYTTLASDAGEKTIYVRITDDRLGCYRITNSFRVVVSPLPVLKNNTVVHEECDESTDVIDGRLTTNLTYFNHLISNNHENEVFTYFTSPDYSPASQILDPTSYSNTDIFGNPTLPTDDIYVKVKSALPPNVFAPYGSCSIEAKIELEVSNSQIDPNFNLDFYACETESRNPDGSTVFPASIFTKIQTALIAQNPAFSASNVNFRYFPSLLDTAEKKNEINPLDTYTNQNPKVSGQNWTDEIWVSVETENNDTLSCVGLNKVATLHIEQLPVAHNITALHACDDNGDGRAAFDTSKLNEELLGATQPKVKVSFFNKATGVLLFRDALPNPYVSSFKTILIKVENDPSSVTPACFDVVTFDLVIDHIPVFHKVAPQLSCDSSDDVIDGVAIFDTRSLEKEILQGQSNVIVSYFTPSGDPLPSPLPVDFLSGTTTLTVKLENGLNPACSVNGTVQFTVQQNPVFNFDEEAILCMNKGSQKLQVRNPKGTYSYRWEYTNAAGVKTLLPDVTSSIDATNAGVYTVTATDLTGKMCSTSKSVTLTASNPPKITSEDVSVTDDVFNKNNTITIDTTNLGIGDYEFSLNDGPYQDSPVFDNVNPGIHTITVRDKNGCGVGFLDVSVLGYPKFFSPNRDGFHDEWKINLDSDQYAIKEIYIFDRYGRLLKLLSSINDSWDGIFKGTPMPADDYWFKAVLDDGRAFKGHFSLLR